MSGLNLMARLRRIRRKRLIMSASLIYIGCLLLAGVLLSCRPIDPSNTRSPAIEGLPDIRVRLMGRSVNSATVAAAGAYSVIVDGRCVAKAESDMPPAAVTRTGRTWRVGSVAADGNELVIESTRKIVRVGAVAYRGKLRLLPAADDTFNVINIVDMENYLAGVLPKELMTGWHLETYKALAVAARTFARYQAVTFGLTHTYDVNDDQSSQVYGGQSAETERSRQAVQETWGKILTCESEGRRGIFLAQYSASCGGVINDAQVLRDVPLLSPLIGGRRCEDCAACPHYRWEPVRVKTVELAHAVALCYPNEADHMSGGVTDIRTATSTTYGRAIFLDVIGPKGSTRLRADDLRLCLMRAKIPAAAGLYSMNCTITVSGDTVTFSEGRGFGHGVGLCQWGAQGKALQGWTWDRILGWYYYGAKIETLY